MKYISHPARTVTALDNYMLLIEYCEGVARLYDVKPLFERIPIFNQLKENNLFNQVHLIAGGDGIIWNLAARCFFPMWISGLKMTEESVLSA